VTYDSDRGGRDSPEFVGDGVRGDPGVESEKVRKRRVRPY
jgi:hypothetical protein